MGRHGLWVAASYPTPPLHSPCAIGTRVATAVRMFGEKRLQVAYEMVDQCGTF